MLLASIARTVIRDGALTLIDADGNTFRFGRASRPADVVVRLHDRRLHHRLALRPYRALAEAYEEGSLTVEQGDVHALLDLLARNVARLSSRPEARLARAIAGAIPAGAPEPRDEDFTDVLFESFLDWDRQYSCAYFADPRMTLEEAQDAKKQHLSQKLLLRPGQKVLDVGCGWGGLALYLAEQGGVDVTGITTSPDQLAVARRRAAESDQGGQVAFRLGDVHAERGRYDRIVSVGALERVHPARRAAFFEKIRDLLTDEGVAVIHAVGRMDGPSPVLPGIDRAILGGHAPALSEILPVLERARLWVTDVEILRLHYAETLNQWRRRFLAGWERVAGVHGDRFCRRWEYRLALGEAAFRHGALMVFEIQLARRADAVPLTREYMYDRPQGTTYEVDIAA